MKNRHIKFAVPDISIEPEVWPRLTPLYLSFTLNAFTITPCAKALKGATDAASRTQATKVKLNSSEYRTNHL